MKHRVIAILLFFIAVFALPVSAHPGGTDEDGGHYDGSDYHYHHGYSAHDHVNGVCPYEFDDRTGSSSSTGSGGSSISYNSNSDVARAQEQAEEPPGGGAGSTGERIGIVDVGSVIFALLGIALSIFVAVSSLKEKPFQSDADRLRDFDRYFDTRYWGEHELKAAVARDAASHRLAALVTTLLFGSLIAVAVFPSDYTSVGSVFSFLSSRLVLSLLIGAGIFLVIEWYFSRIAKDTSSIRFLQKEDDKSLELATCDSLEYWGSRYIAWLRVGVVVCGTTFALVFLPYAPQEFVWTLVVFAVRIIIGFVHAFFLASSVSSFSASFTPSRYAKRKKPLVTAALPRLAAMLIGAHVLWLVFERLL